MKIDYENENWYAICLVYHRSAMNTEMDSKAKAGKYCFYCYTIIKWSCFHGLKQQANVKYLLQSFKLEKNKIKNFLMKFLKVDAGGDGKVKIFLSGL